jgi:single-stranded-DNA-specific exonuclease
MRELLKSSNADPLDPDSEDVAFRIAPRINAAGRVDHPAAALAVVEAASDPEAARVAVAHLDRLNLLRRELVRTHFDALCGAMAEETLAAVVLFCEQAPKGIAGLLASKCVERFGVPSIILVPPGFPEWQSALVAACQASTSKRSCRVLLQSLTGLAAMPKRLVSRSG